MELRQPNVGEFVAFCDSRGKFHDALVTEVHGDHRPSINLVYVSSNGQELDVYGRQIKRDCSVVHMSNQEAKGHYWCFAFECKD